MAKFVIAGRADCPYYAKSELLADKLATNLEAFSVHKVTVRPDEWASWLQQNCSKHGFKWNASPVVWRELTERGGRGSLLGGYNEFCEYAKLYYAQDYEMSSALAKDIAEENKLLKIREENEKRTHLNNLRPLQVTFTNPTSKLAYQLLAAIVRENEVFDSDFVRDGIILNSVGDTSDKTKGVMMELEDLSEGKLAKTKIHENLESVVGKTDILLILDENDIKPEQSRVEWINEHREHFENYGKRLNNYKGKIFINGHFATLGASLMLKNSNLNSNQVLTTAAVTENIARASIGRKLRLNPSKVHNINYIGSTLDCPDISLCSLASTSVQIDDSAIVGPLNYERKLDEVLFDFEWKNSEFDRERQNRKNSGPLAQVTAIVKVLKQWFSQTENSEAISCGTIPPTELDFTSSYLCLPGKFNKGNFFPIELDLSEPEKVKLFEMDRNLARDEKLAQMSVEDQNQLLAEEQVQREAEEKEKEAEIAAPPPVTEPPKAT